MQVSSKPLIKLKYLSIIISWLIFIPAYSQTTKITGKIVDATTKEPLPFINVVFKNSSIGTTSDFDGNYIISTDKPSDSLVFTYIGYLRQSVIIKKGVSQNIVIAMNASAVALKEVVIKAGENPANIIFRKVVKNKDYNDPDKLDYYQYEVYNKIEFDVNNITDKLKKSTALKPFKFIFNGIDSTDKTEKPSLPLFLSESISDFYYRKFPTVNKEVIKATKVAGVDNKSVSQFTGDLYQNVDIYTNTILVFGKSFISPVSDNGLLYYRYYLIDSLFLDNHWCYQLQFKPRRKQELTFTGNMWINDTTFAVKRLEMNMAGDANINYINTFNVVQDYTFVDGAWMIAKDKLVVDFILQKNRPGFYGRKTTSYNHFVINKPKEEKFYSKADNLVVADDAQNKTDEYWKTARHDTLSKNEKGVYKLVDTIRTLRAYRTYQEIIESFTTGYIVKGYFEYGPFYNSYSYSRVEGNRIRLGGRTSNKFSKWNEFSGYVAYGFLDDKIKFGIGYRGFITKHPRQMYGINYKKDYQIIGQSRNAYSYDNFIASLFRIRPLTTLTNISEYNAFYSYEWLPGIESKFNIVNKTFTPLKGYEYLYVDNHNVTQQLGNIVTSEVKFTTRIAIDEKYIDGEFTRQSLGTKWPIVTLQYTLGLKGVFKSNYTYHKANFLLQDRIRVNPLGYFDYVIDAGKIWGNVPYPLMEIHSGNETYFYDPSAYNMMKYSEFVSDEYVALAVTHHFDGLFLNKIPLMRKLKWREVVSGKGLYGEVTKKNKQELTFPTGMTDLNKHPYYEAGVGIENVFKVLRFDVLWRLSHLDVPNISRVGFRGTLQIIF